MISRRNSYKNSWGLLIKTPDEVFPKEFQQQLLEKMLKVLSEDFAKIPKDTFRVIFDRTPERGPSGMF